MIIGDVLYEVDDANAGRSTTTNATMAVDFTDSNQNTAFRTTAKKIADMQKQKERKQARKERFGLTTEASPSIDRFHQCGQELSNEADKEIKKVISTLNLQDTTTFITSITANSAITKTDTFECYKKLKSLQWNIRNEEKIARKGKNPLFLIATKSVGDQTLQITVQHKTGKFNEKSKVSNISRGISAGLIDLSPDNTYSYQTVTINCFTKKHKKDKTK